MFRTPFGFRVCTLVSNPDPPLKRKGGLGLRLGYTWTFGRFEGGLDSRLICTCMCATEVLTCMTGCTCLTEISTQWPDDKPPQQVFDRSVLPSAPRSSSAPKVDQSRLPTKPPFTVYLGNLSFECAEDDITRFFERRNINVRRSLAARFMYSAALYYTPCMTLGGGTIWEWDQQLCTILT